MLCLDEMELQSSLSSRIKIQRKIICARKNTVVNSEQQNQYGKRSAPPNSVDTQQAPPTQKQGVADKSESDVGRESERLPNTHPEKNSIQHVEDLPKKNERKISIEALTLIVTVVLAISGYIYTYNKDIHIEERRAQLVRTNLQLRELYGPLYSLSITNKRVWEEFRKRNLPDKKYWSNGATPSQKEAETWRLWMMHVFIPENIKLEEIILNHTDLLIEDQIPQQLLDLLAHIEGYRAVIAKWKNNDFSEHTSFFNFPKGIKQYAETHYLSLKRRQKELIGELEEY